MNKIVSLFFICCVTFATVSASTPRESMIEKIYVDSSQLHLTSEGIFFLNGQGILERTESVFCDDQGIYIFTESYQCPGCKHWNSNNICSNTWCSLYGR